MLLKSEKSFLNSFGFATWIKVGVITALPKKRFSKQQPKRKKKKTQEKTFQSHTRGHYHLVFFIGQEAATTGIMLLL